MDAGSRGVFCQISEESRGGVKYLNFATNSGLTSQQRELALELQSSFVLGINNGIIVGYQTFVTEGAYGGFIGYDVQCPNCVRNNNNYINPTYPVRMASSGIATCSKCGRKYDMNNGGIIQNGGEGDTGLEKYVATAPNGPQGYLNVFRR